MVCYLATRNETSDGSHSSDLVVRNNFHGSVDWSHHEPIQLSAPGSVVHTQRWDHGSNGRLHEITNNEFRTVLTRERRPSVGAGCFCGVPVMKASL